jgi:hypothetical protein
MSGSRSTTTAQVHPTEVLGEDHSTIWQVDSNELLLPIGHVNYGAPSRFQDHRLHRATVGVGHCYVPVVLGVEPLHGEGHGHRVSERPDTCIPVIRDGLSSANSSRRYGGVRC